LVAWLTAVAVMIVLLPDTLALILSIAVTFGHTAGALTWVRRMRIEYQYQLCIAVLLCCAIAIALGIRWGWQASPRVPHELPISARWRWATLALLGALAAYLFLWPRNA
jgi:hypothetical protein